VTRRLARHWRWALAAGLLAAFIVLAVASKQSAALSEWDQGISEAFRAWQTPVRTRAFWLFTLFGDDALLAGLTATAVVLLWAWGRRALAVVAAEGLIVSWGLMQAAKALVDRVRPSQSLALIDQPGSQSLPSGHAVMTAVFSGLLVYALFRWAERGRDSPAGRARAGAKWIGLAAAVLAAGTIGVSRVYLGAHWLSDVLAGWCLAGTFLTFILPMAARREAGGGPKGVARDAAPWAPRARWALVAYMAALVCGLAVIAGLLDPLR
jgi:membrane-associated phospholipid phosphatase